MPGAQQEAEVVAVEEEKGCLCANSDDIEQVATFADAEELKKVEKHHRKQHAVHEREPSV